MSERLAVGAIVVCRSRLVLVRKVKMMDGKGGEVNIPPEWDFPRGGLKSTDSSLKKALQRELKEELGLEEYKITNRLPDFCFQFDDEVSRRLGFKFQRTYMFIVEAGQPILNRGGVDEEIDMVASFTKAEAIERIKHESSRVYCMENVNVAS